VLFVWISDERLLIVSHIKAWSKCDKSEKYDTYNGFLFYPNHDKLFDKGFITFGDNGNIIISSELNSITKILSGINANMKIGIRCWFCSEINVIK